MVYSPVNPWTFPVNPNFPWVPDATVIASITQANPCIVTTTTNHGYSTGFNVRVTFPFPYSNTFGMTQINGLTGAITVLSPMTFSMPINTLGFNSFKSGNSPITNITRANPAVVTVTTNNFFVGQTVTVTGVSGMTQINDAIYIVSAVSGSTVSLNLDSSAFSAYAGGGTMANTQSAQIIPIGQYTNIDLDDSMQVNPPNPQSLAQVPIFQKPGLQAGGPVSPS